MNTGFRCYESHPPLSLGDGLVIYGGSCLDPAIKDADVYVGFDLGMKRSPLSWPWVSGESFLYPISDMRAPVDLGSFLKLLDWLELQLTAQRKVHLGCVGGHGRTGMVLAALVSRMLNEENAIQYVRDNYCHKAVESNEQINFLVTNFSVKVAGTTKGIYGSKTKRPVGPQSVPQTLPSTVVTSSDKAQGVFGFGALSAGRSSPPSIWTPLAKFDKLKNSGKV